MKTFGDLEKAGVVDAKDSTVSGGLEKAELECVQHPAYGWIHLKDSGVVYST